MGLICWIKATDFLLAQPDPPEVWAVLSYTLAGRDVRELQCPSYPTRGDLPELLMPVDYGGEDAYGVMQELRMTRPKELHEESDLSLQGPPAGGGNADAWELQDFFQSVEAIWRLLSCSARQRPRFCSQSEGEFLRGLIVGALLRRLRLADGALTVLASAQRILRCCGASVGRWIVYRAWRSLYVAEARGESCQVPLETAVALQALYVRGELDLDSFIPLDRRARVRRRLLPRLRRPEQVARLVPDVRTLVDTLIRRVPWLTLPASTSCDLHLTGSLLCHSLLMGVEPDEEWPGPGDVDLYCSAKDLPRGVEAVAAAMQVCYGAPPVRSAPSCTRWVLRSEEATGGRSDPARQCDVYVNSLRHVTNYHLPMVRASFSLQRRTLHLTPSCVIALVTSLNVDFQPMSGGRKTPQEILSNKWLWGFNFFLKRSDCYHMEQYLAEHYPQAWQRAMSRRDPSYDFGEELMLASYGFLEQAYALPSE